jgi:Glu-tRNA(Gln) amidotransferase subunit E-like FAD-binding protein
MRRCAQKGQVLIILLGALFLGGSAATIQTMATGKSIETLESDVKRIVKDPDRAQAVLKILEQWKAEGTAFWKAQENHQEALHALIARHDATREAFAKLEVSIASVDARYTEEFMNIRASIRENMTRQEWQAVFGKVTR